MVVITGRASSDRSEAHMKITRVETIPVRVPIHPNLAIKSGRGGSHALSPFLLVKVHTDDGIVGLGEASCTPRWSGEDQFTAQHFKIGRASCRERVERAVVDEGVEA